MPLCRLGDKSAKSLNSNSLKCRVTDKVNFTTAPYLCSNYFNPMEKLTLKTRATQLVRLVCAVILLQTLFFKFGGALESIYIFETVGLGTPGRIGTGIMELIASILLFIPRFRLWGAVLAIGLMAGAILSHLTVLGIEVLGDHGKLFFMALTVFVGSTFLAFQYFPNSDVHNFWKRNFLKAI